MSDRTITEVSEIGSSITARWEYYLALCKPNVVMLIIFTAIVGMLLSTPGTLPVDVCFFAITGIGLAAAAGATLNQLVEQHIDARMTRTRGRPLPQGEVEPVNALLFATGLVTVSMLLLVLFVNILTALLTFISFVGYAVIYTMFLKRTTSQNIVLGGAAGAAPPILGWTAVTGEIHSEALILFLIIFIWTPPHFWSLAIRRRDEYARVGIPMLPVTHGIAFTKLQILLYTILLVAVSVLPFIVQMSGLIYLAGALALGCGFLHNAVALFRSDSDRLAMKTFAYSIFYLGILFAFLLLDHYARLFLRAFVL